MDLTHRGFCVDPMETDGRCARAWQNPSGRDCNEPKMRNLTRSLRSRTSQQLLTKVLGERGEASRPPTSDLLEGVSSFSAVDDLEGFFVNPERDGDAEDRQGDVGRHADDAEVQQAQESHHQAGEDERRLASVPPVEQVCHCRKGGKQASVPTLSPRVRSCQRMAIYPFPLKKRRNQVSSPSEHLSSCSF